MAVDLTLLGVFVMVLARTAAWVMAAPVFGVRGAGAVGRLGLAVALSVFLAPLVAERAAVPADTVPFALAAAGQVVVGLALGWATGLLLHAFEVAGHAIDLSSGFSVGTLLDPVNGAQAAVFSRFANMLFIVLFFATESHQTVLEGFARSFVAVPPGAFPAVGAGVAEGLGRAVGTLLLAALEVGAPVLGALFLTEVALAVAARFAPQANVFVIGLPAKVLVTLLAMGSALVLLPGRVAVLVEGSVRLGARVLG
jgi:flagellar biosynthetic protein FliR